MMKRSQLKTSGHEYRAAILVVVLFYLILPGCQKNPEPLEIGFIGSLSGKFATMGITARDGAILAVEKVNEGGGVCGRQVELLVTDDGGIPASSLKRARELSNSGVKHIIGPLTSSSGSAVLPFVNENGILTISPTTTGLALADQKDLFIKFSPNSCEYGQYIAQDAADSGTGALIVLHDSRNPSFCSCFMDGLDKTLIEAKKEAAERVEFDSSEKISYSGLARTVLDLSPDGVVFCSSSIDTALLSQHLKKTRPDLDLYSSEWAISKSLIENGGQYVEGLIFFSVMNFSDTSPKYKEFQNSYIARFGKEPTLAAMSYFETVHVLVSAIQTDCSVTDPSSLVDTIVATESYAGVQRDFRFDDEGDAVVPLMRHVIKDGKFIKSP